MKPFERDEARRLRREQGLSIKEIAQQLHVSKSSVSQWVRDIQLTNEQLRTLEYRHHHHANQRNGSRAVAEKYRELRRKYQEEGRIKARERDPLHVAGCMLFWAEGKKNRNALSLVNSDPDMLVFFMRFLCECLHVADDDVVIHINCYTDNGLSIVDIEKYWLSLLRLPSTSLRKSVVNQPPISSSQRGRKLPYGVCAISVYKTRLVQHVYGAIQEYIGIDKPEWLL